MGKYFLKILLLAIIIFLAANIGLKVAFVKNNVSLLWPPTGIGIVALLLQGKQLWPGISLGIFWATASTGIGFSFAFGAALANTVETWLAAWLIDYWKIDYSLDRVRDVLFFILIILLITPLLGSVIGTSSFCLNFACSHQNFVQIGWRWWLGNAMGGLVIIPPVVSWITQGKNPPQQPLKIITIFTLLTITNLLIFGVIETNFLDFQHYPLEYLCFPFLIWAGFSLKQRGATTAIFITVIIAIIGTFTGSSPFNRINSVNGNLLLLWSFISVVSLPTLFLSAAVAEREVAEESLAQLAYTDSLTNLPNRAAFLKELNLFLKSCQLKEQNKVCAVLFIDLYHFKDINDSVGHIVGDKLLFQIARRLESCLFENYIVARLGGDEFAILIPTVNSNQETLLLTQEIIKKFQSPFLLENCEFLIRMKIGWTLGNCTYEHPEDMVRDADIAMYNAKISQKEYCQFEPEMRRRVQARMKLEQGLQKAISNQELELFYQPIIALATERLLGFEALLRWHHPEEGWISPSRFIPLAEQSELIKDIGRWVLNQACLQLNNWENQFSAPLSITVSVNVSPKQMRDDSFVDLVHRSITDYQINPKNLKLEITETAVLEVSSKSAFERLKAMGVGLYLDDFGIGESSLSRLCQLPLDVIKIDQAFVRGIPDNKRKTAIAHTIVFLGENMELNLIAEGIETKAQQEQLLAWGCERGQGYLFSKPVCAEDARKMIEREMNL